MDENVKRQRAQKVYETLCNAIENRNWNYKREDNLLLVHFGVSGEDIPMNFIIVVDADRQIVRLMSRLPFKISEEKRLEGAIMTCAATNWLADGSFDYDVTKGEITFRLTESFRESELGDGVFQYMISCACSTIDAFNDKFLAVDKGFLSLQDFLDRQ